MRDCYLLTYLDSDPTALKGSFPMMVSTRTFERFVQLISTLILLYETPAFEATLVEYDFIIRSIPSNPDGYPRPVVILHYANASWNSDRAFPGPLIRARLGDRLRVRFTNRLRDQSTAIHFHGLHMLGNPWVDGSVHITQCPIDPHETLIVEFNVTQTGTFWYHSHHAQQYSDGLVGPIILDPDPLEHKYHYGTNDYVIMLQEWYHETWSDLMTAYMGPYGAYRGSIPIYPWPPTSFLINGHGQFDCRTSDCTDAGTWRDRCGREHPAQCIPLRPPFLGSCNPHAHPVDEFLCPSGEQIRLRLINAASGIPFRFWIEQHNLTIIARDGIEISPITVHHLHIATGQRLDLIVDCHQEPTLKYAMFVASRNSYQPAENITGQTPSMWTWALLVYSRSQVDGRAILRPNEPNIDADDPFFEFKYLRPKASRLAIPASRRVTLVFDVEYDNRTGIDSLEEWTVNGITFEPPQEPLLHANIFDGTLERSIANERHGRLGNVYATHIEHFEYGQTYEVVMINHDSQLHPWHLHGYSVDFIAAGALTSRQVSRCNQTQRNSDVFNANSTLPALNSTPPVLSTGDSFNVPRNSYVAFRFTANNPGPWFLHCHMEWHIWPGMSLVFSVGRHGRYDGLIQSPPSDLSTCGTRRKMFRKSAPSTLVSSSPLIKPAMSLFLMILFISD